MACPTYYILMSVTLGLMVVHSTMGYSFRNCIEDQYSHHKNFSCIKGTEKISSIVGDLPSSTVSLTIVMTHVWHIPKMSFAHLPNLEDLKLDHNNLMIIDEMAFQSLHQLKSLNLSYNNISELHPFIFKDLHNLTFLSLVYNKIKQLPVGIFSNLFNLNTLQIRQNFLVNFSGVAESVSHLYNLKILDLCFNNLTSLRHSNTKLPQSLTKLYLCQNNLSTLDCEHSFLRKIQILDLSYNPNLPSTSFKGVDLRRVNYLRLRSTNVKITELFNVSNVNASHVDFSGMGLNSASLFKYLCVLLNKKTILLKKLILVSNGITDLRELNFLSCPQITGVVDISRNQLKNINCLNFLEGQKHIESVSAEHNHISSLQSCKRQNIAFHSMKELSVRYNQILSVNSFAFYHTPNIILLKLNINKIAYLDREALKGLKHLKTLRLDNNLLTDLFNNSFQDLESLITLNLRNNRISVIFNGTFRNLSILTTLDLGGNKITHFDSAGLDGLKSLSNLYLDGNQLKEINNALHVVFHNTLQVFDLQGNQIRYLSHITHSPFSNLSKLRDLKLDRQRPHGITTLPSAFFRGLHSLQSLYLSDNYISGFAPDAFDDLTDLRFLTLDNSCVGVVQLEPGVFKNLRNLTKLIVENMGIQDFSKEVFGNLTNLITLQLNHNVMQNIHVDALDALIKLRYLDIRNIPLSCTCQNSHLQNWTQTNEKVQVVYLYNLPCPGDTKKHFYNFDTKVCYIDLGKYLFFTTAAVTFLFTVFPLLYVKLYWKIKYSYYVFCAWFGEQWRRLKEEDENCKYDAFISYNSYDEPWVLNQLLPNLEGNGSSFKLCLHHRDFEPGRYIVDNIVSAVYGSRKTICIVSQNFLRSEWCSLEIQLASYRLFDEHRDVLLLVFLEPIPERQLSSYHRMRKVMLKKTYLQWPGSDCPDPAQAQDLFWTKLRRALRRGNQLNEEETDNNIGCVITEDKKAECNVNTTSDEKYYSLP